MARLTDLTDPNRRLITRALLATADTAGVWCDHVDLIRELVNEVARLNVALENAQAEIAHQEARNG